MNKKIKRRSFLKTSSLLSIPVFAGGFPVSALAKSQLSTIVNGDDDRVLVIIQLNGGNDGLNTIIPRDQQENLAVVRENIFIPENQILELTDTVGVHPSLSGVKEIFDDAKLNIIQSVAYPNQNRSHFRSLDIWNTGANIDEFLDTGWVGRYFDNNVIGYPENFPNSDCPDPFALTVGSGASETCQGNAGNYSMVVIDPEDISSLPTPINNEVAAGCYGNQLDFLVTSIEQSNEYGDAIESAFANGNNASSKYGDDNQLAAKLKTVARLIKGGLQTKIYVVTLGGFDTHADQVVEGDVTNGGHAVLLKTLGDAMCAFQDDLKQLGLEERVMGMTYSEFGRRIRSNFSLGTDHGTAAPLMVFGKCVNPGILGDNPIIDTDAAVNEGVPMQYDFRSIYGSILIDWFKASEEEVQELFSNDFQYLPILSECTSAVTDTSIDRFELEAFPNPHSQHFTIRFTSGKEWVKISLFDTLGGEVRVITNKNISGGNHIIQVKSDGLVAGAYFVRLQTKSDQKTIRVVKI